MGFGSFIRKVAGDDWNKLAGNSHKSVVDPAGILGDGADPLKIFDYSTPQAGQAAPTAMPDADSEAVAAARRRRLAAMKNRGGRQSTILGGDDLLGG
jgi:hypothetical protein